MAIAYKSQGAGVSTETNAAALSPACPATVDAGDILIAHVFYEGTGTGPSTPSGWELLAGPYTIETTIARHWVFGKIAAGTEDGSTVAFGTAGGTNQRAARIYSFSGRTSGTILELAKDFAHTSNANDPTAPNVTTTKAGALAVLLVAQNDNNAFASFAGESGGNYVEAVAEYTAALTPGLSLGIQTATPTSDPGTITGGTDNTTNDPAGVIGFQILPNANQSVTADVGAATATGFSPTVTATNNQRVTADLGAPVVTGLSPTVTASNHQSVTAGLGAPTVAGFAPVLDLGIVPGVGAATANGFAPTVSITDNQLAQPGVGVVTATGLAPALDLTITAGLGQVVADGFSPVVTASDHKTASPDVAVVAASALEPTVTATQNQFAAPDVGALTASGFAPQVQISDHQIAAAGLGDVALQGVAPAVAVSDNQRADAQLGALLAAGFAPVVQLPVVVTVGLGQVVATGLEPDAEASTTDIEPRVGVLTIVGFAPNVEIPVTVATASGAAQLAGHAPEVQVLVEVLPEPGEVLAEGFSPSVAIVSEFGEGYWPVVRTMPDGSEVRVGINYPIPNVRTAPKLLRLSLEGWRLRGERLVLNYWTMIRKRPALQAKLLFDDGSPLNLVDARAVSFILNDYDGDELLRAPVEIINHAAAHVRYRPARNDIQQSFRNRGQRAELGHYLAGHFRVDWTDDTFLEWPLTWRFKVEVL